MKKDESVESVPFVDLDKYMGVWYEIGRYPCWFEKGASHVRVEYTLRDNYVEVINRCIKKGKESYVTGKAYVMPDSGNAKLKVRFKWPFQGDYWIIDLDEDYSWAAVSNPKKTRLWILYREPNVTNELLRLIAKRVIQKGFNSAKIIWTEQ